MKTAEKILDALCVVTTIIFFVAVTLMVLVQGFAVITLNGALSTSLYKAITVPASMVSAVSSVITILSAYMRGQMKVGRVFTNTAIQGYGEIRIPVRRNCINEKGGKKCWTYYSSAAT